METSGEDAEVCVALEQQEVGTFRDGIAAMSNVALAHEGREQIWERSEVIWDAEKELRTGSASKI